MCQKYEIAALWSVLFLYRHTPAADPCGNPAAAKELQGLDNLTGNEFAERLLHSKLYSIFQQSRNMTK